MTKEQRQKLFDHMSNEHGITLLESQIDDNALKIDCNRMNYNGITHEHKC